MSKIAKWFTKYIIIIIMIMIIIIIISTYSNKNLQIGSPTMFFEQIYNTTCDDL
jgi:hypothetical protein